MLVGVVRGVCRRTNTAYIVAVCKLDPFLNTFPIRQCLCHQGAWCRLCPPRVFAPLHLSTPPTTAPLGTPCLGRELKDSARTSRRLIFKSFAQKLRIRWRVRRPLHPHTAVGLPTASRRFLFRSELSHLPARVLRAQLLVLRLWPLFQGRTAVVCPNIIGFLFAPSDLNKNMRVPHRTAEHSEIERPEAEAEATSRTN